MWPGGSPAGAVLAAVRAAPGGLASARWVTAFVWSTARTVGELDLAPDPFAVADAVWELVEAGALEAVARDRFRVRPGVPGVPGA